jgi:hypothetical protein
VQRTVESATKTAVKIELIFLGKIQYTFYLLIVMTDKKHKVVFGQFELKKKYKVNTDSVLVGVLEGLGAPPNIFGIVSKFSKHFKPSKSSKKCLTEHDIRNIIKTWTPNCHMAKFV